MSSWLREAQENILKEWIIAEIEVNNITPIRIGGYTSRPFSSKLGIIERIRSQSIKGLWRWWARAILAGVKLSIQGKLLSSISEMNNEIMELLGSTGEASYFFIQIYEKDLSIVPLERGQNVPRVRLLRMGLKDKREEQYYDQLKLKLIFGTRKVLSGSKQEKNATMFALSSLLISLLFSGIGSITSRGFGKLNINKLEPKTQLLKEEIESLNQMLNELYNQTTRDGVTNWLRRLIRVSLNYAAEYKFPGKKVKGVEDTELPPLPTLLLDCKPEVFRLETICISNKDKYKILENIGISTLKAAWKLKVKQKPLTELLKQKLPPNIVKCLKIQGKGFHTWVLGLPRYQEPKYEENGRKKGRLTGYTLDDNKEIRRRSPIEFTIIKCRNGNFAVVLYGFLTNEFTKLLKGYKNLVLKHTGIHTTKPSMKGVVGKITKVDQTNVYDDILTYGIASPKGSKQVSSTLSLEDIYRECFDAAWQFVNENSKELLLNGI